MEFYGNIQVNMQELGWLLTARFQIIPGLVYCTGMTIIPSSQNFQNILIFWYKRQ